MHLYYDLIHSSSQTEKTVDLDKYWNMAQEFDIFSGMTIKKSASYKSFSITVILKIFYYFYKPEVGYQ